MPEQAAEVLEAWVREYVARTSGDEEVEAFVRHVDTQILGELPELAGDPVLVGELHASTRSQFQVFLSLLEREKQELLLPPQAVDLALSIARRQLDLGVLLKVYRVAAAAVWEYFTAAVAAIPDDGPDRTEVLIYLWGHGGTWINEAIEELIGAFAAEREATMRGALARRAETVHALVRGETMSVDVASTELGHSLRSVQTAFVLWSDEGTSADALADLNRACNAISTALGTRLLSVAAGRGELWCWAATRAAVDVSVVREVLDAGDVEPSVRVAVGVGAPGVAGFVGSHREAVEAQRHAVALASSPRFLCYADVELPCLAAGNEGAMSSFIARELGALADDERGHDRLRETVASYLTWGGNVDHVANELMIHKNTVRYRLAQAEELLGRPLTDRRTEVSLALRCFERYGASGGAPG